MTSHKFYCITFGKYNVRSIRDIVNPLSGFGQFMISDAHKLPGVRLMIALMALGINNALSGVYQSRVKYAHFNTFVQNFNHL